MRGECEENKNCVMSKNYPRKYGNQDSCWITMITNCNLQVWDPFDIEVKKDHLMIQNKDRETKESIPRSLSKGEEISWITSTTGRKGWKICMTPQSNSFSFFSRKSLRFSLKFLDFRV